jgi:hypothetical protein
MEEDNSDLGFAYRIRQSGEVDILHFGRRATTLRGMEAREFVTEIEDLGDIELQQEMALLPGNYQRGNERTAANHPRNRKIEE